MGPRVTVTDRMSEVVARARDWIGTPYQHQAAAKDAGCDCLGLVRGIHRELSGRVVPMPPYTPNWPERLGRETLLQAARDYLDEVPSTCTKPGDILAFRLRADGPVTHVGILSTPDLFIHAYGGRAVCESAFVRWWRRRHTHSFRFRED